MLWSDSSFSSNGVYLCDLLRSCDWLGELFQLINDCFYGHHDSASDLHGVGAFADGVETLFGNGTGQHCGGGGAVAGFLVGVISHILHQLGADVLIFVLQVDALGYRHTILGDLRAAPALLDDDSATLEQRQSEMKKVTERSVKSKLQYMYAG